MAEHVCIRNVSLDAEVMVALGGEISTQPGTTFELFEKRTNMDYEKNIDLIKKVVRSGHTSILEHLSFSLLLSNVSICIEEFFIEHRLASFTVKSRRYVDFGKSGYYVPNDLPSAEFRQCYVNAMDSLFNAYNKLIDLGIPKEDARFVLPYSFYSNFVCTVNAREAIHIITDLYKEGYDSLVYGECDNEYLNLYTEIMGELKSSLPWLHDIIANDIEKYVSESGEPKVVETHSDGSGAKFVEMPSVAVFDGNHPNAFNVVKEYCTNNGESIARMVKDAPRELEVLNYFIELSSVSLATVTHLVRHRMQSIIVPKLNSANSHEFVLPETIVNNVEALTVYCDTIRSHIDYCESMKSMNAVYADYFSRPWFNQYMLLAGNTMDLKTTMNARELLIFLQLRTCNRAQWEIQYIADEILKELRNLDSVVNNIFDGYGPSCYVQGMCPEGRMCCGEQDKMKEKYFPVS